MAFCPEGPVRRGLDVNSVIAERDGATAGLAGQPRSADQVRLAGAAAFQTGNDTGGR